MRFGIGVHPVGYPQYRRFLDIEWTVVTLFLYEWHAIHSHPD